MNCPPRNFPSRNFLLILPHPRLESLKRPFRDIKTSGSRSLRAFVARIFEVDQDIWSTQLASLSGGFIWFTIFFTPGQYMKDRVFGHIVNDIHLDWVTSSPMAPLAHTKPAAKRPAQNQHNFQKENESALTSAHSCS
jgi:hypothetical protein